MWSCVPNTLLYLVYLLTLLTYTINFPFIFSHSGHIFIELQKNSWKFGRVAKLWKCFHSTFVSYCFSFSQTSTPVSITQYHHEKPFSICYIIFNLSYHLEEFCNEQSPGNSPQSWTCQPAPFLLTSLACWETILLRLFSAIWGRKNHASVFPVSSYEGITKAKDMATTRHGLCTWRCLPDTSSKVHSSKIQQYSRTCFHVKFVKLWGPGRWWRKQNTCTQDSIEER